MSLCYAPLMVRFLQYLWCVPMALVSTLVALIYIPTGVRIQGGALEFRVLWIMPFWWFVGGQTLASWVVTYRRDRWDREHTKTHERKHVRQFLKWGPLAPFAYGAASLVAVAKGGHYYRDNWFERDARDRG